MFSSEGKIKMTCWRSPVPTDGRITTPSSPRYGFVFNHAEDPKVAFDTVNSDGLWKVMQKFGCPERFTHMVRQLHDGMMARVSDNGTLSEAFVVINGMKQDCVLAPTLFSLRLSAMLMDAYRNEQPGNRIAYRTDGHLLDSRRMQASTRVCTTTVHDLLFADDCALNTVTEEDMLRSIDHFAAGCADFGLTISTAKTSGLRPAAVLSVESPQYSPEHQTEDVQGRRLDDTPSWSGDQDRILEPSQEAESLPSQLPPQNTEAEMARQDPDTEVLERTGILSIHAMLRQVQLRRSGHLVRMDGERLHKRIFYGDVATGARQKGGQKRRYKDTLKKSLK
ncbi:unnamed protein product [Schistocephalus solidus]|uniref:Reverse transcriptase domain-containing protein n=1 Tax=Schistocephalus solidus TaxID=70667 RepID=A0A183SX38_SCHSO|nr:unnamed protein product [Schistocephalus solidus]